jgi:N-formylglutamate deformylase
MGDRLPIAIISPHGGLAVPPALNGRIALTPSQIFNEADAYVDDLFNFQDLVLHWVTFPFARAILDMNRPADPSLHHRPGDAVVKEKTSYGSPVFLPGGEPDLDLETQLIDHYWRPWHEKLASVAADPAVKLVIDAHTMAGQGPATYDDPHALRPRVMVGNMGDLRGELLPERGKITASAQLARQFEQILVVHFSDLPPLMDTGQMSAMNIPFYGGWNLKAHGGVQQPWLMIEISRALYLGYQSDDSPIIPRDSLIIADIRMRLWQALTEVVTILP